MEVIDAEMSSTAKGVGEMAWGGIKCRETRAKPKPHRAIQFQGQVEASKETKGWGESGLAPWYWLGG